MEKLDQGTQLFQRRSKAKCDLYHIVCGAEGYGFLFTWL